jgi:6-phosphofructokinase 1
MAKPRGNVLIGQSGGPTAVINQSLVGLVEACLAAPEVGEVYGALHGIDGVLAEDLINLGLESPRDLERVANTPCAALGSVRRKPGREDCARILRVFRAHDVRTFFYIGGNDSAETAHLLNEVAQEEGDDLRLFHVPKTIDNDLEVTDHCPGYGSAARFVALALMGDNEDNRSLSGVKIDVIMGRHAGWLTAAASLARRHPDDGPHLVYVPEVAFDVDAFLEDVARVVAARGRCLVAVSEGIHDAAGRLIQDAGESDAHGNLNLSGGSLGDQLAARVRARLDAPGEKLRVRADTFGYLQRSFFGLVSEQDAREAREVAHAAVRAATAGEVAHGSLVILRGEEGGVYVPRYDVTALENVARKTKVMPASMLRGDNDVSDAFRAYAEPLVGALPVPGRLSHQPVPRRV